MIVSAIGVGKAIKINNKNSASQYNKDIAFSQGYKFKEGIDIDLRGKQVYTKDAVQLAFEKTGVPKDQFIVTKWGYDKNGKTIPVEYKTLPGSKYKGAEVSVDVAHDGKGTLGVPHVGWQTPGKGKNSVVGHILLDDVSANRSKEKNP
ncbi:polymorphic toxin type 47 domain-containing protein [Acinetobacter sp. YH12126]|uniref:polymorphic toxin type 47 domain-containing protein n=1 Tax=Acinetobacter sp. YH12126 TaxID=2601111 RepID=UPI0035A2EB7B